jgi:hypothetical protein
MKSRKYTEEQFIQAVKENYSIRGVLIQLSLKPSGGNYAVIRKHIKELRSRYFTFQRSRLE